MRRAPSERVASLWAELRRRLSASSGRGRKLRGLIELLRPYRVRAIAAAMALLLGTAALVAPPLLAKLAIDRGIAHQDFTTLAIIVGAFLLTAFIAWATTYLQTYLVGWIGQRALQDLRLRIFSHLQTLPVGFYESRPTGVLISRMTNDVEALDALVTDSVVTLFQSSLTLLGTLVLLLTLDVKLALITFALLPLVLIGGLLFRIASVDAFRRTRETIGAITAYVQESLSGIRVVRSFAQEHQHEHRFAQLNADNRTANMRTVYLNAAYFPATELIEAIAIAMIAIIGGYEAINGTVTIGTIVAFIAALENFFDPIQQLSQLYTTYQSGMAALEKIFDLLDVRGNLDERPDAVDLGQLRGEIRFEDVTFVYQPPRLTVSEQREADAAHNLATLRSAGALVFGPQHARGIAHSTSHAGSPEADGHPPPPRPEPVLALDHVDLLVPAGQTLALVGATGAGKSTFAKLVGRFYDPTAGRVLIDGHDLREIRLASLRSQMGIVPQEGFLFAASVRENIAFGRPGASQQEVEAAARAVGAGAFIERLERGYETEVGERGVQLSAGQRQLIAFARALIADPRILILDEATSNVDLQTEARIEAGLRRLLAGRTAIVIAHRLSTIKQAGRIVVLDKGRIVEQGTHEELLAAEGHYHALYRAWSVQHTAA